MGLPVPEHQPGDCCRWGTSRPSLPLFGNPRPKIQSHLPQVIQDIAHLDVLEVRHNIFSVLNITPIDPLKDLPTIAQSQRWNHGKRSSERPGCLIILKAAFMAMTTTLSLKSVPHISQSGQMSEYLFV